MANLEKVVALARKARELGVLTLRGFTRLLSERIRTAREEPDLPATRPGDPDTVRILSIHKAKGLEAPIVALYDTGRRLQHPREASRSGTERTIAVGFRDGCQPPGWDALVKQEEARAWAEGRRLLYVACTRARDLLVIPRPPGDARAGQLLARAHEPLPAARTPTCRCGRGHPPAARSRRDAVRPARAGRGGRRRRGRRALGKRSARS